MHILNLLFYNGVYRLPFVIIIYYIIFLRNKKMPFKVSKLYGSKVRIDLFKNLLIYMKNEIYLLQI